MKDKLVYGWFEGEECFYIGLGTRLRSRSKNRRNERCRERRKNAERENNFQVKILADDLTLDEAVKEEIRLIRKYGREDLNNGQLTNRTNGGERGFEKRINKNKISGWLKQVIDSYKNKDSDLAVNPQNMVKAYLLAYKIQEGKRFFEYFNESTAKSPTPLVLDYMRSIGAPAISTISANNIKDVLFHDIDRNKHKTALLKGVAQAYFDVCLFLGIASICTGQRDLNYTEAACIVELSLTTLEKGYNRVCDLLSPMKWSDDLTDFERVASGTISFTSLRERFKHSVSIIQMYKNNRVKYNQSYDSIVESVAIYRQAEIWMTLNNKYIVTALHIEKSPKSNVTKRKSAKELVKNISQSKTLSALFDNSVESVTTEEFMDWVDSVQIPEIK